MEVDDRAVHSIYRPLVNSGLAFGAKRWIATLDRQCERLASALASNIPAVDGGGMTMAYFFFVIYVFFCSVLRDDMIELIAVCSDNKPRGQKEYAETG